MEQSICWKCVSDPDIVKRIKQSAGKRGCSYCKKKDAVTANFDEICSFIRERLEKFYGLADNDLPFDSREGGFQGKTWDTYDLLTEHLGDLPRDTDGRLFNEIRNAVGEEVWCEYDWLSLDKDVALSLSWQRFCKVLKHQRRFFFHNHGLDREDRESYSPRQVLRIVSLWISRFGLIKTIDKGSHTFRARPCKKAKGYSSARDLGPPGIDFAKQQNRMNPAGIPMMYVSEKAKTAAAEVPGPYVSVGKFETTTTLTVIDLCGIPGPFGIFSEVEREAALACRFLQKFLHDIMQPVDRLDRAHIDYLPSQVVTEYFRSYLVAGKRIDGIRYGSVAESSGTNIVFFCGPERCLGTPENQKAIKKKTWFKLKSAQTQKK